MDSLIQTFDTDVQEDGRDFAQCTLYSNSLIGLQNFGDKGRGVIALRDIPPGTRMERCPVLIIPEHDRKNTDQTVIFTYIYMWEHDTTEQNLYDGNGRAAIALGLSSLLNHSYAPNASFIRHIDHLELELRSDKHISAGEEVTIDYQMKLWFELSR